MAHGRIGNRMRVLTALIAPLLFNAPSAPSQSVDANALCLHNGAESYVHFPGFELCPSEAAGKYFPSYTHFSCTSLDDLGAVYPWKLRGWTWTGMQAANHGPTWYWKTCLQRSVDNPYASTMSFDYPELYCNGTVPVTGLPQPLYGARLPKSMPVVGGEGYIFPSSMGGGGWKAYQNIFAVVAASWVVSSTRPFYGYDFTLLLASSEPPMTVPSDSSIWTYVWTRKGPFRQYLCLSDDEQDCLGAPGNKGRSYSVYCQTDYGCLYSWSNPGNGIGLEWSIGLWVCDAVTVPVNVPGSSSPANPFAAYGFDAGVAAVTPLLTSGALTLGFMTGDRSGAGVPRVMLACLAPSAPVGPYGEHRYRIRGYDALTSSMLGLASIFLHTPSPGYPSGMFGTTSGAHTTTVPIPLDPWLVCTEICFQSLPLDPAHPPSAAFTVVFF